MEHDDQQDKLNFSAKGVWLGFIAYIVVVGLLAVVFLYG